MLQIILGQIIRITHDFQYLYLLIIFIILAFQNIKNCSSDSNFDWPIHHNTYNIPVYFKILYHPL